MATTPLMQLQVAAQAERVAVNLKLLLSSHSLSSSFPYIALAHSLARARASLSLSLLLSPGYATLALILSPVSLLALSRADSARAHISVRFSASELYLGELWYYPMD